MKLAHYNKKTKQLLGWYDESIHLNIPEPVIRVTEEIWEEAINKGYNKVKINGTLEYFDFRTTEEINNAKLLTVKVEAKRYLDSTDWYVTRFIEKGIPIPEEVKIKRDESRMKI